MPQENQTVREINEMFRSWYWKNLFVVRDMLQFHIVDERISSTPIDASMDLVRSDFFNRVQRNS